MFGCSKIGQLDLPLFVQEDVGWLDIAVHHALCTQVG